MFNFKNDYSEGCHPQILEALTRTNFESTVGYGMDPYCAGAAQRIREAVRCPEADVHFLMGGTQTNQTAIAAFLRPHQCVIAAATGHVNVHETGAIEATGHKVITLPAPDGKLTPDLIQALVDGHPDEHMVKPGLVYISQSTELGTVYSKTELEAVSACCRANRLYLYLDGARLACGLTAEGCGLTLADLPRLCDAFYIGGTKNGLLFGEALVIVNDALKPDFRYHIKQRGGMLAKGRLLGVQFGALFQDDLYLSLGRHSNLLARKLTDGLKALGYPMFVESPTNQIFPVIPNEKLSLFASLCLYEVWGKVDDGHTAIRLVTSWASREEDIDAFLSALSH